MVSTPHIYVNNTILRVKINFTSFDLNLDPIWKTSFDGTWYDFKKFKVFPFNNWYQFSSAIKEKLSM